MLGVSRGDKGLIVRTAGLLNLVLCWLALCALAPDALAKPSCLPDFVSLAVIEDASPGRTFSHPLMSRGASGPFVTKARLVGSADRIGLKLEVRFESDGVSLPYTIYAVLVATDNKVVNWEDLTQGCDGPGISIFPGQHATLTQAKFKDKKRLVHIIVWGRL